MQRQLSSFNADAQEKLHMDLGRLFPVGIEAVKPGALLRKALHYEAETGKLSVDGRCYLLRK